MNRITTKTGNDIARRSAINWCKVGLIGYVMFAAALFTGCEASNGLNDLFGGEATPLPSEAARWMFDQYDPDRRRNGTVLIMNAPFGGEDVYVRQYRDMVINERDPIVKAIAIRALGRYGEPMDASIIAVHLVEPESTEQVRWEAAKAMQRLHNPNVVEDIITVLRDDTWRTDIRVALADALGQYPEDRVFQSLVAALDQRELAVNVISQQSLVTLTGEDFGLNPTAWLRWYNQTRAAGDNPFAGQQMYEYPTYHRDETFFEKIAFWSPKTFEQPGPPAGIEIPSERQTYDDSTPESEDEAAAGSSR